MLQSRHQLGAGEEWRRRRGSERSIPMKKPTARLSREKFCEEVRRSGVEGSVELCGELSISVPIAIESAKRTCWCPVQGAKRTAVELAHDINASNIEDSMVFKGSAKVIQTECVT